MTDSTAGATLHDGVPLAITLCSTSVPMMLQLPLLSVFAGLTVFRSRAVEEGRERFRMHLGYFYDLERAEKVLVAARRFYPGAFLAEAPRSGMGSLDDTMNAAFQFAKGPAARLVVAQELPPESELQAIADPAPVAMAAAVDGLAAPAYDDDTGVETPTAAPTATPTFTATDPEPLPATVELDATSTILDVATPAPAADASRPGHATAAAGTNERVAVGVQRYAVQLKWSLSAVDPQTIPHHALFRQFTLYGVSVPRGAASEHGLRLGFFSNLHSAKQVADYVRHDFPHASVVPVSERELVRAQQAAWNELFARVGAGARRAPAEAADDAAPRSVRRDGGLRRLWGRQR